VIKKAARPSLARVRNWSIGEIFKKGRGGERGKGKGWERNNVGQGNGSNGEWIDSR
jgi:hypothetical protein